MWHKMAVPMAMWALSTAQAGRKAMCAMLCATAVVLPLACNNASSQRATLPQPPYYSSPELTPTFLAEGQAQVPDSAHMVRNAVFTTAKGKAFELSSLRGKPYLANFFFTRCQGICPRMQSTLHQAADSLTKAGLQVPIISISVMPDQDNPTRLLAYAETNALPPQWQLLTGGTRATVAQLAKTHFLAPENLTTLPGTSPFLHTEKIFLVDAHGHVRGVYNGTLSVEVPHLLSDVRALNEADNP